MTKAKNKVDPKPLLSEFAKMCKQSSQWQGDGWGIAYKNEKLKMKDKKWQVAKSLNPIWENQKMLLEIPRTTTFIVHARSASFDRHKDNLEFNQPFVANGLIFVFNGFLQRVKLKAEGEIGAQKIFALTQRKVDSLGLEEVLDWIGRLIHRNTSKVEGLNIGLSKGDKFAVLCDFAKDEDYYTIRYHKDNCLTLVCSEPLPSYKWQRMNKGEVAIF